MSKNVDALLNLLDDNEQALIHGIAWRAKLKARIMAEWRALPFHKRVYWTLRGARPV